MEIGPNQEASPKMPDILLTPCSSSATPSEVVSAIGGNETRRQWGQDMFADASTTHKTPLLPFNNISYLGTMGEKIGYSRPSRPNVNVEVDGAQPQIAPSKMSKEPVPKTSKRSSCSADKLLSASGLECPMCGIKFTRRSNCKEHQKMHNPEWKYNYPCEKCNRSFGRRSDLKRHMNTVHLGICKHCCDSCDRRFSTALKHVSSLGLTFSNGSQSAGAPQPGDTCPTPSKSTTDESMTARKECQSRSSEEAISSGQPNPIASRAQVRSSDVGNMQTVGLNKAMEPHQQRSPFLGNILN